MALRACKECGKEISSSEKVCPNCGKKQGTSAAVGCLAVIAILFVLGHIGSLFNNSSGDGSGGQPAVSPSKPALSQVTLKYSWYKVADGMIMHAYFTIKNEGNQDLKDFVITCQHFAHSGTPIDSNTRTIYEVVRSHSVRTFRDFDMGFIHSQAASTACSIVTANIAR